MIIILIANIHHYGVKWCDSINNLIKINSSEPLRSKVGGASKPFAMLCGLGPPGEGSLQFIDYEFQLIYYGLRLAG